MTKATQLKSGIAAIQELSAGVKDHAVAIVNYIAVHGPQSRATIMTELGVSRATASRVVGSLLDSGILREEVATASGRGRPVALLQLDPSAGLAVGVDFGFRNVRVVVARVDHSIVSDGERTLTPEYGLEAGFGAARELVEESLANSGATWADVVGVGIAIGGPINQSTGQVTLTSLLPQWSGDVAAAAAEQFPRPVFLGNDAQLSCYAELLWGAGRAFKNFVYMKIHSGIGGGIVIDGRLHLGAVGAAGELGHMTVEPSGTICRCGNRGCLETLVGVPALLNSLDSVHAGISWDRLVELKRRGDPSVTRALDDAFDAIGRSAGTLANVFNPDAILLGGAVVRSSPESTDAIRKSFLRSSLPVNAQTVVATGTLGREAAALGAVGLALLHGLAS